MSLIINHGNGFFQTSGVSKKRKTEQRSSSSSDSESEDRGKLLDNQYQSSKTAVSDIRRREFVLFSLRKCFQVTTGPQDMGATSTVETETDFARDSRALFEKAETAAEVSAVLTVFPCFIN